MQGSADVGQAHRVLVRGVAGVLRKQQSCDHECTLGAEMVGCRVGSTAGPASICSVLSPGMVTTSA